MPNLRKVGDELIEKYALAGGDRLAFDEGVTFQLRVFCEINILTLGELEGHDPDPDLMKPSEVDEELTRLISRMSPLASQAYCEFLSSFMPPWNQIQS